MSSVKFRVAVVGSGNVSDMHFKGYAAHPDRVSVVAAVDPIAARRTRVTNMFGVADTFASVDELLEDSDFSVAVVCTPSDVRVETVEQLARAGKHIMVEKPMADNLTQAQHIVDVCRTAGVKLAVDQNFRDHYSFGLARDAIRSGAIGNVLGIDHRELVFREVQGWRAEAKHHSLSVMGVHWLDGFRYLLPVDADWLVARTYSSPMAPSAGETDAFVQIHFGSATVNYTQSFSSHFERVETIVVGDAGTLALTYGSLEIADSAGTLTIQKNPYAGDAKPESAYRSIDRLLTAVESDSEPSNGGLDNMKTLSLLAASYRSAETGAPVELQGGLL
jgi:predicted dehydrogenase